MKSSLVSAQIIDPYASALMETAKAHDLADRFGEDARFLLQLVSSSTELQQVLANPLFVAETKKAILRRLTEQAVHPFVLNFLMLLVDRRRITFLDGICNRYEELLRQLKNTVLAEVTTTTQLTTDQQRDIARKVAAITGARGVALKVKLDPELIGGVIVKVGSRVIDASLRGQLRRIALRLGNATT